MSSIWLMRRWRLPTAPASGTSQMRASRLPAATASQISPARFSVATSRLKKKRLAANKASATVRIASVTMPLSWPRPSVHRESPSSTAMPAALQATVLKREDKFVIGYASGFHLGHEMVVGFLHADLAVGSALLVVEERAIKRDDFRELVGVGLAAVGVIADHLAVRIEARDRKSTR